MYRTNWLQGGDPEKIGQQTLQAIHHRWGGDTLPKHPHNHTHLVLNPHHPNLREEGGRWAAIPTPQHKVLFQGGGTNRGEAGIQRDRPQKRALRT